MGPKHLIDSNSAIDFLRGSLPESGKMFMIDVINDIPSVSIISKIEVLSFKTTPDAHTLLTDFFNDASILPLSEEIAEKTIELRQVVKIKLPDAIIAATALIYNLKLITRNIQDFQRVPGLISIDPHKM